jgi:peptide deformylase
MIHKIVAYGDPVLKKPAEEIEENYPNLKELIADMFETMYEANGVGLAAPQIGLSIRLFIVDGTPFCEDEELEDDERKVLETFKKVFINPIIVDENGTKWAFEEGCLSIPGIREDVSRHENLTIEYYDEKWNLIEENYNGIPARIIQHEYDHIEGILFTDKLSPLKKRLLKKRLSNITKGNVDVDYAMRFPVLKKGM